MMGANWRIFDDQSLSGGRYIGSENGDGNGTAPGAEWVAAYNFAVPAGAHTLEIAKREEGTLLDARCSSLRAKRGNLHSVIPSPFGYAQDKLRRGIYLKSSHELTRI